jgi:uncharacterized protein (DUF2062 family)/2-polyprenyl-3-methyl-5-hydroxy-6-metoxy-1,4-benzoquinol methylase
MNASKFEIELASSRVGRSVPYTQEMEAHISVDRTPVIREKRGFWFLRRPLSLDEMELGQPVPPQGRKRPKRRTELERVRALIASEGGGIRGTFRALFKRLRGERSPLRLGISVGLGLFIGCLPLYGLHLPLCLLVCVPFRLDLVAAYLAANISNPVFAPFLLLASAQIGAFMLTGAGLGLDLERVREASVSGVLRGTALGSVVLGSVLGLSGGFLAAFVARVRLPASELERAIERTVARYRTAPRGDRYYVRFKLRLDPVLRELAELGPFGDVIDAGAGRGQLGICLFELGLVRTLTGFDYDSRKVALASAALPDARFVSASAESYDFGSADTLLLVDVLHYLEPAEQDRVLARAKAALRDGGRLFLREVEGARGSSGLTRLLERIGARLGINRARTLAFRPLSELIQTLEQLGLECSTRDASRGTPLSNALVIATFRAGPP